MFGVCKKGKDRRKLRDRAETWAGCRVRMGGWVIQGWHRKETAILRTVGVFKGRIERKV
jgi:hypothetical protein